MKILRFLLFCLFSSTHFDLHGVCSGTFVKAMHYMLEGLGFVCHWCHWNFYWRNFPATLCTGIDSTCNRHEYQEYFLPGEKADNLLFVWKSGRLNLLEHTGLSRPEPLYCNCLWTVGVEVWKVATDTAWPFTDCCFHSVCVIVDIPVFQFHLFCFVLKFFANESRHMHAHLLVTCVNA
jgi:hypothetical protein